MAADSDLHPSTTIEHYVPSRGYVTLTGTVAPGPHRLKSLAVMPFVWRFAPAHGRAREHGWRRASRADYYLLDDRGGWTVTDVRPGVQYAVIVVGLTSVTGPRHQDRMIGNLIDDGGGMLPYGGLSLPAFTHDQYDIHIGSAPDDHLTGAVLGVGRATWEEPGIEAMMSEGPNLRFRMAAWATKEDAATKTAVTFFVKETRCDPSGYWTFDDLPLALKHANTFTVALVTEEFDAPAEGAPTELPAFGPEVRRINSRRRQPLRTHGSRLP